MIDPGFGRCETRPPKGGFSRSGPSSPWQHDSASCTTRHDGRRIAAGQQATLHAGKALLANRSNAGVIGDRYPPSMPLSDPPTGGSMAGDDIQWMTYAELAETLGIGADSARNLVRRKRWARQTGNDGLARIGVPVEHLEEHHKCADGAYDAPTSPPTSPPPLRGP